VERPLMGYAGSSVLADALDTVLRGRRKEPAGEAGMQWTDGALQEAATVPLFLRARARRLAEERARTQGSGEVTREIFLESRGRLTRALPMLPRQTTEKGDSRWHDT